ncbi:MAG: NAD-dependent epimerase/dehydratase family protein [Fimbriimonas sp.]
MSGRVLVTAGGGLVGRAVVNRLLAEGRAVTVLDEREAPSGAFRVSGRVFDASALSQALEGVTSVVHLEWSGGIRDATADPFGKHQRAVTASLALLEEARVRGLRLVFASTCVYRGDSPDPLPEDSPLNERAIYTVQKRYVEMAIGAYVRSYGLSAATLRFFNVYGPGGKPGEILPRLRAAIAAGEPIRITGDGGQRRDFVHVEDVAAAVVAALEAENPGAEPINIGTGVGTSMLELVALVGETLGRPVTVEHVPAHGEEARFLVADVSRARERLGWVPTIDLRAGLQRVIGPSPCGYTAAP